MNPVFENYIAALNAMYENAHKSAFVRSNGKSQRLLIRYNSHLFSRWYHSTLLKGTLLSPANLVYLMNRNLGDGDGDYYYPAIRVTPNQKMPYSFSFTVIKYNLEHHPAAVDFRAFLDCISPAVNLDMRGQVELSAERLIMQRVSIKDPYYSEFFLSLAHRLKLVKKAKGVHVSRIAVTAELEPFLELTDQEIFGRMFKESVKMCAAYVGDMIPGFSMPIQASFIESLLKTPFTTKDIMSKIYNLLLESFQWMLSKGMEFEITSPQFDKPKHSLNMSEQDLFTIFTSGSYVLNALFVKHFFTTFGDFLKLIEPFYEDPFTFKDFQGFLNAGLSDPDMAFFIPCSHYSLTPVALEFFDLPDEPEKNNIIHTQIPLEALFDIIPPPFGRARVTPQALAAKYAKPGHLQSFRLKITQAHNDNMWKIIELTGLSSLEQLHHLICDEFLLEPSENYRFNTDIGMNTFTMYTPPHQKLKHKKTHNTLLKDMPLDEKTVFYYCLDRSSQPFVSRGNKITEKIVSEYYKIEVVKIKIPIGIEVFPKIIRESAPLKEHNFFSGIDFGF